jgi:hypothetical protein
VVNPSTQSGVTPLTQRRDGIGVIQSMKSQRSLNLQSFLWKSFLKKIVVLAIEDHNQLQ